MRRRWLWLLLVLLLPSQVWAVPDQTMTIAPTAVSGTTITAADENSRNNSIATPFNAHTHTDLTKTTNNIWTVGDATLGNKDLCESGSVSRCIRYDATANLWTMQQGNTNYNMVVVASGTTGLTSNGILLGQATGAITATAQMTNGQVLIGSTSVAPVVATLTAGTNVTVTNGAGSITINAVETGTWTDVTSTRTTGTTYRNTSGKKMRVAIALSQGNGANRCSLFTDSATPASAFRTSETGSSAATGATLYGSLYAEVPNNWYYQTGAGSGSCSVDLWQELNE